MLGLKRSPTASNDEAFHFFCSVQNWFKLFLTLGTFFALKIVEGGDTHCGKWTFQPIDFFDQEHSALLFDLLLENASGNTFSALKKKPPPGVTMLKLLFKFFCVQWKRVFCGNKLQSCLSFWPQLSISKLKTAERKYLWQQALVGKLVCYTWRRLRRLPSLAEA